MATSDPAVTPEYIASLPAQLAPGDRLRLAERIIHELTSETASKNLSNRAWRDIRGIIPHPAFGEDAQAWVTRHRADSDRGRWRSEP